MEDVPRDLPHLYAEGIEYSRSSRGETSYPDIVERTVGELDALAEDFEGADGEKRVLHLYRGDSRENLESLESVDLENLELTSDLNKEFPLYFTTSEAEARDHSTRKPTEDKYLLKLEVPFENLERIRNITPVELARNYESIELNDETMY
jgi:hypothetical protein